VKTSASPAPLPVQRVSTVEAVSESIRRQILSGDMPPGTELKETELSETYGVGRHSIRAAIQALAHQGIVRHVPHKGAFVPELSVREVADLYIMRTALELEAARRLASRPADVELPDAVDDALQRLEAVPPNAPWDDVIDADLNVHRAIVEAVGSSRLQRAFDSMMDELRLCLSQWPPERRSSAEQPGIDEHRSDHSVIIRAIHAREADEAVKLLGQHLTRASEDIQRVIREGSTAAGQGPPE
jgi:DNA-binding GntR family transcriptional regulator